MANSPRSGGLWTPSSEFGTSTPDSDPAPDSTSSGRRNILVTGYWPPTNEMLRRFSTNPEQNPEGWLGENWQNRNYDIHALFPEFANSSCGSFCGAGGGPLPVDYQSTEIAFNRATQELQPIAIITFSRGEANQFWSIEQLQYNHPRDEWVNDYLSGDSGVETKPTNDPPDPTLPPGAFRPSTLPSQYIINAVNDANIVVQPFDVMTEAKLAFSVGKFLSEYIRYLAVWYQQTHNDRSEPAPCLAAGGIHVGAYFLHDVTAAEHAVTATLHAVIKFLELKLNPQSADLDSPLAGLSNDLSSMKS